MSKALSAYSDEHIYEYFERVKAEGLTEHGFPRLTVNLGVLIAHGYRADLTRLFIEMMDFCCEQIPKVKAANDFSVREVVFCLMELQGQGVFIEKIEKWKRELLTIVPHDCYDKYALKPDDVVNNWALFSALSEFARSIFTNCDSNEFIELQLENQLRMLDENGMYMDNIHHVNHQPIMYDLVPRYLLTLLLHFGYRGRLLERIDSILKSTALLTLKMQSLTGEMAFGGRSNQFVHNEPMLAIIYEFEANRYAREGDLETAGKFKAAIERALEVTEYWLAKEPIRHIKNRFPTETKYGCEKYAYFDKYMITTASHLFSALLICDDSIAVGNFDESATCLRTSAHFHKLFMRSHGYFLEFDTDADPHYDSSGLGRVHRHTAPSTLCLSLPCTDTPKYKLCTEDKHRASLCPGKIVDGEPIFTCDINEPIDVIEYSSDFAAMNYPLDIRAEYSIDDSGITISLSGEGDLVHMIPAFFFDGEAYTDIRLEDNVLTVEYEEWTCKYSSSGMIKEHNITARNRNGYYKIFYTQASDKLTVNIKIFKK